MDYQTSRNWFAGFTAAFLTEAVAYRIAPPSADPVIEFVQYGCALLSAGCLAAAVNFNQLAVKELENNDEIENWLKEFDRPKPL